ncbi:MAG: hypothetical protein ACP5E3_18815 [Bacteroidales bacterium]
MKTSIIYIILLIFGILLIVPAILLKSNNIEGNNSYGVEYNLGWGHEITVPARDTQNQNMEILDFYEEEYELEDWMMEPETWEIDQYESGKTNQKSSASGLSSGPSGVSIQIIAEL